jgi:S1-C subfamily serine protease
LNLVDLTIVLVVLAAAAHGIVQGAAVQALSFAGFGLGLVGGAYLAPYVSRIGSDPTTKAVLSLVTLLLLPLVLSGAGRQVGTRIWDGLRGTRLGSVDAGLGGGLAAAAAVVAVWVVASMLATVPTRPLAAQIQRSTILKGLGRVLPPAPSIFSRVQGLLDRGGFPPVFAEFERAPSERLPLPSDPAVRAAVARAGASTVKITGIACGFEQDGSGFVADPGIVITNAHVVAGVSRPAVIDRRGTHSAVPIFFDPNMDLAVLRVSGLADPKLSLLATSVPRGTSGAVLGYPGGGPFDAEPAVVLSRLNAIGRNIYSRGLTTRTVYEVRSRVRPGNSGGPLVRSDGSVAGVIFSRSARSEDIGYALTSDTVRPKLAAAEAQRGPVSTGPCTAG